MAACTGCLLSRENPLKSCVGRVLSLQLGVLVWCVLDGADCNRQFIKLHFKDRDPTENKFVATNIYTGGPAGRACNDIYHGPKLDVYSKDPFLHRLVGRLFLARSLNKVFGSTLDIKEFLSAAKTCVMLCSTLMATLDSDNKLEDLFGNTLYKHTRKALDNLHVSTSADELQLHLEVQKVRNLSVTGIRSVFGPTYAGAQHVYVDFLGQHFIATASDMNQLLKEPALFSVQQCRNVAESVFQEGFRFQVDVKFMCRERFYISQRLPSGLEDILHGSKELVSSVHQWQFESSFDWSQFSHGLYPLSWIVSDIDKFVQRSTPSPRALQSFF